MRQARAQVMRDRQSTEILVPLRGGRRALGALALRGVSAGPGDEIDLLDRLEEVARQLSTAIENVLLLEDVLRSRRELESTFNSMADLVVVCDSQLTITHAQPRICEPRGPARRAISPATPSASSSTRN